MTAMHFLCNGINSEILTLFSTIKWGGEEGFYIIFNITKTVCGFGEIFENEARYKFLKKNIRAKSIKILKK